MKRYRRALFGLLATTMIVAPTGADPWKALYRHQFQVHPGQRDMPAVIGNITTREDYIVVANAEGVWRWRLGQTWERLETRLVTMPTFLSPDGPTQIPRSIEVPTLGPTSAVAGSA